MNLSLKSPFWSTFWSSFYQGAIGAALTACLLTGCATPVSQAVKTAGTPAASPAEGPAIMNHIAESYVKLVLAVGQHDSDYVDAYYGPPEWKQQAETGKRPLPEIRAEAASLLADLHAHPPAAGSNGKDTEMLRLRHEYLTRQIESMVARIDLLAGKKMKFDEESKALYDTVAPTYSESHFQGILSDLEALLPAGPDGASLTDRVDAFRKAYVIPQDRLGRVFDAAIAECHRRTAEHITLPAGESFVVEYVKDKPWSGYNWFKGGYHSVIQVNTDQPTFIDRAIDLACHEGYPGHHVYNTLLEQQMVKGRGWPEFSVYPLFSPQSLIAEGTANFGIEVAFPGPERVAFEKKVLFPLAGLDPAEADRYYRVQELTQKLSYAGNEAARRYLDGAISREQAVEWLMRYALTPRERSEQRMRFIERYRSYVINYNFGQDLVKGYVEKHGGTADHPQERWRVFTDLISSPRLPSGLR
jgi:hypothetical protein